MFKFAKHIKLNKRGAGMVTVIVAIALISVLASTLLSVTYMNYKMKVTNLKTKDTFYSAETALDEINMGLQSVLSRAVSNAYLEVMANYSYYSADTKNDLLEDLYYNEIFSVLATDATRNKYKVNILNGYLKSQTWNDTDGYGCVVSAENGNNDMITYSKSGIVLKNVQVYCKDQSGYSSMIVTDIRLSCPTIDFGAVTSLPDILDYSIIGDSDVNVKTAAGRTTSVLGSLYANKLSVISPRVEAGNPAKAVFDSINDVSTGSPLDAFIISKNDMNLSNATVSFGDRSEVWTQSLVANSTKVSLTGNGYFSNDINLKGNGSAFNMSGNLYAYGNSMTEGDKSSAILINGTNTSIDFTGAQIVMIAGHAFISTGSHNTGNIGGIASTAQDVYTGESLSIKSNQLMYLIPGECLGVVDGLPRYGQNPMTAEQYVSMMHDVGLDMAEEVATGVTAGRVGAKLEDFIAFSDVPDAAGYRQPLFEKVFVQSNGSTMVYYYMKFASEKAANDYFKAYYGRNTERFTDYLDFYTDVVKIPDPTAMVRVQTAGNMLKYDGTNSSLFGNTLESASSRLAASSTLYTKQLNYLTTKLMKDTVDTTNAKYTDTSVYPHIVFDNIVDVERMVAACDAGDAEKKVLFSNENNITVMIHNSASYAGVGGTNTTYRYFAGTPDKDKIHCIVATGNVSIESDFTGLIICDGTVTVAEGVTVKAEVDTTQECLRLTDAAGNSFYQYLRDGSGITSGGNFASGQMVLSDLIIYENWTKR